MTAGALSICWAQSLMRAPDSGDEMAMMLVVATDAAACSALTKTLISSSVDFFGDGSEYHWL